MYWHSSQNHNDVVILTGFFSFQVEVAKQKKQHENNQIYFIDILFFGNFFSIIYLLTELTSFTRVFVSFS